MFKEVRRDLGGVRAARVHARRVQAASGTLCERGRPRDVLVCVECTAALARRKEFLRQSAGQAGVVGRPFRLRVCTFHTRILPRTRTLYLNVQITAARTRKRLWYRTGIR